MHIDQCTIIRTNDDFSGIGAGIDSFFEYLLKAYVLFGDDEYLDIFNEAYAAVMRYIRDPNGIIYSQINMYTGEKVATWIDSLSAFFPGLQVLYGDLDNAKRLHELYFTIWRRFNALPERWDYHQRTPIIPFYPLRPELMESTYMLYQVSLYFTRHFSYCLNNHSTGHKGHLLLARWRTND